MAAGKFDKRVAIQTKSETLNPDGSLAPVWTQAVLRWAMISDNSGGEVTRAKKIDATVTAVITLRSEYASLSVEDRIVYGTRTFWIKSILGTSDRTATRSQILDVTEVL